MEDKRKMKSTTLLVFVTFIVIGIGIFLYQVGLKSPASNVIFNEDKPTNEEVQPVTLSLKNGNYYPQEVHVKAGQPVEITLDKSVIGCYRSLVIKGLGVSVYSKSPSEKIALTPDKPGMYRFSCSMGMGYGKLIAK